MRPNKGKNEEFPFWAKGVVAQKGNVSAWKPLRRQKFQK